MFKARLLAILLAIVMCNTAGLSQQQSPFERESAFVDTEKLSAFSLQKFYKHIESKLPLYKSLFQKHAKKHDFDWTFLAAVAYQESQWNEDAVSHTGVRGLMQLTTQTAEHIGISDREDAYQSIKGGAFYLRYLYNKTNPEKSETERWIQALCAYNIGWGHLMDAHRLAKRFKKNPYDWNDLKNILPLLQDKKYFKTLRYGYARGNETVDFVQKVFTYHDLLAQRFNEDTFMFLAQN